MDPQHTFRFALQQHTGERPASPDVAQDGARKRQKVTRACDLCKSKKKRCSGELPCTSCTANQLRCTYLSTYTRGRPQLPPQPGQVSAREPEQSSNALVDTMAAASPGDQRFPRTSRGLSSVDNALPNSASSQLIPTGSQPPVHASDINRQALAFERPSQRASPEATSFGGQYLGPTSAHSFLKRAWKRLADQESNGATVPGSPRQLDQEASQTVPIFRFGDKLFPGVDSYTWRLPVRAVTDILLSRYFDFAAPTYRFLHRPTTVAWLDQFHQDQDSELRPSLSAAKQAIVLLVLASASLWKLDANGHICDAGSEGWKDSELFYSSAEQRLAREVGPPTLESVQARLLTVLFLLSSSRANQAWFTFGTVVQLLMALGLHRKRFLPTDTKLDHITRECQKRVFWSAYTLDKYLSVMFGGERPQMIQDEDVDQELPQCVNDEDLTPSGVKPATRRKDCLMHAPIFHARLARIVGRASRGQYAIDHVSDEERIDLATRRNREIAEWQAALPAFLSDAVEASSLIPVLERQSTVLRLAHAHAIMLINRPLLLRRIDQTKIHSHVQECLTAAKSAVELVMGFVAHGQMFPTFWYTQYITFNALSILYIYIIQRSRRRLGPVGCFDEQELSDLAQTTQRHLDDATRSNAPNLRYSIILDELRQRARAAAPRNNTIADIVNETSPLDISPAAFSTDLQLDLDFWPQLDSLPLCKSVTLNGFHSIRGGAYEASA